MATAIEIKKEEKQNARFSYRNHEQRIGAGPVGKQHKRKPKRNTFLETAGIH